MIVPGTVTRTADFGAFVELEPGLEGLIHISELANQRIASASAAVKPAQNVRVRILEIDPAGRRMSLSLKKVAEIESPAPAAGATAAAASPDQPKKKRSELRGGLDFDYRKNK
jgi:small subunit ribosomal protein S1